jgi:hypothetical protein
MPTPRLEWSLFHASSDSDKRFVCAFPEPQEHLCRHGMGDSRIIHSAAFYMSQKCIDSLYEPQEHLCRHGMGESLVFHASASFMYHRIHRFVSAWMLILRSPSDASHVTSRAAMFFKDQ